MASTKTVIVYFMAFSPGGGFWTPGQPASTSMAGRKLIGTESRG
jgi:hypothetical protein